MKNCHFTSFFIFLNAQDSCVWNALKNTGHTYNSGHQFSDNRKRRNADEDLNDKCLCAVGKWCIKANDEKLRGGNAGEKRCLVRAGDRFVSKGNSSVFTCYLSSSCQVAHKASTLDLHDALSTAASRTSPHVLHPSLLLSILVPPPLAAWVDNR